jgi:adenylylsulfate kinase-like enzyme
VSQEREEVYMSEESVVQQEGAVIWIFGRAGSGKTTLAKILSKGSDAILLDGDDVRDKFGNNDYTLFGRWKNIRYITNIIKILIRQGFPVIVSAVTPYNDMREYIRETFPNVGMIYLKGGELWKGSHFDEPGDLADATFIRNGDNYECA